MFELVTLQTISYIAGASSVILGVIYYVNNLRETNKNHRITTMTNLLQSLLTPEFLEDQRELGETKWKDFDDFRRKYDHSVNWKNFSTRMLVWGKYDVIGSLLKRGLVDIETLYCVNGQQMSNAWIRWKPIIEEFRKISYGMDAYTNWEYAAYELAMYKNKMDPTWKYNTENFTPENFDNTFKTFKKNG